MELSKKVIEKMMSGDAFSQWLGIELLESAPGFCKIQLKVREEMTNGFNIAHGGISYSLADSCLAFAANSYGTQSVSIETSISHTKKVESGDLLIATSTELNKSKKTALYSITISNQDNIEIAHFKGTVYRTGKEWFPENNNLQ
ncbi:MAG: hotdog fold thioesterase [Flavobacteriales bacterium]|jgi:acyl-CoA thioesterase|tara:strand:+ start:110 stop:541 length:432 start_codon:yes stop_codon:yes gene_type:complete